MGRYSESQCHLTKPQEAVHMRNHKVKVILTNMNVFMYVVKGDLDIIPARGSEV